MLNREPENNLQVTCASDLRPRYGVLLPQPAGPRLVARSVGRSLGRSVGGYIFVNFWSLRAWVSLANLSFSGYQFIV